MKKSKLFLGVAGIFFLLYIICFTMDTYKVQDLESYLPSSVEMQEMYGIEDNVWRYCEKYSNNKGIIFDYSLGGDVPENNDFMTNLHGMMLIDGASPRDNYYKEYVNMNAETIQKLPTNIQGLELYYNQEEMEHEIFANFTQEGYHLYLTASINKATNDFDEKTVIADFETFFNFIQTKENMS